jgi:hypothetical protein
MYELAGLQKFMGSGAFGATEPEFLSFQQCFQSKNDKPSYLFLNIISASLK